MNDRFNLHSSCYRRWSLIAGRLPGRTANDVKNFWNTHISKKSPPAGENGRGKIITKSNIVRPRPRTFSNSLPPPGSSELRTGSHSSSSSIRPRRNDVAVVDEALTKRRVPSSSTSLSAAAEANDRTVSDEPRGSLQEDLDECMRWWGNLVEMMENGEQTPLLFSDDAPLVTAFPAGFGEDGGCSSADGEGLYGNLMLDGDGLMIDNEI